MRLSKEASVRFVKMTKKSLVLAVVATGTLLGSIASNSALASPTDTISIDKIILIKGFPGTVALNGKKGTKQDVSGAVFDVGGHLQVESTKTVAPKGKKRARNAERRRQRQLRQERKKASLLDAIEMALELKEFELADELLDELEELGGLDDFDDLRDDRDPDSWPWWWPWRKPVKLKGGDSRI